MRVSVASMVTELRAVAELQLLVLEPLLLEVGWDPDPPGIGPVPHAARRRTIPPTAIPMRVEYRRWWDRGWII